MLSMYLNNSFPKSHFRETLYNGTIWLNTSLKSAKELCAYAEQCILEVLGEDPRAAHRRMNVENFVSKVAQLKGTFTNSKQSKRIVRSFIEEIGQKPADYFFDVPRLRVVPTYEYLHSGVSYAYKPHRDTWYGGPNCQINTWMTVYPITPAETMMINPAYFDQPIINSSSSWDIKDWIERQRPAATINVKQEDRNHPLPLEELSSDGEMRLAGERAEMIIFSGAHLHGTVPNHSDKIRFSIDFRIFHKDDIKSGLGAVNRDSGARNVEFGFKDYFRAADFTPFSEASL